jgi:glycerophosphoryl diester phosphodiesterase
MAPLPLLLGHRGSRGCASIPENTFASFDLALEHGCDGFEFDVRLTGDGRAVICHDAKIDGVEVAKAHRRELTHLPLLGDLLSRYGSRAFLDVELKAGGLESQVLTLLQEHAPQKGYTVSSFLPEVLSELRTRSASINRGFICDKAKDLDRWRALDVQYLIPHYSLIGAELVSQVHAAGRALLAWTVNDRAAMLRLKCWGVDGVISDNTELLVATLGEQSGEERLQPSGIKLESPLASRQSH